MTALLVVLGGAVGAPARYLTDRLVQSRHRSPFPWGTMAVNLSGCFILGLLIRLDPGAHVLAAAGAGFCGAFTTYSTFAYETVRLAQGRDHARATANVAVAIVGGLACAYAGGAVASLFLGVA